MNLLACTAKKISLHSRIIGFKRLGDNSTLTCHLGASRGKVPFLTQNLWFYQLIFYSLVISFPVVVLEVMVDGQLEMSFAQGNDSVQAFILY